MGTLFRQTPNNGYPFPPKWPLKMGTGLAASAAHPRPNNIWVPPPPPRVLSVCLGVVFPHCPLGGVVELKLLSLFFLFFFLLFFSSCNHRLIISSINLFKAGHQHTYRTWYNTILHPDSYVHQTPTCFTSHAHTTPGGPVPSHTLARHFGMLYLSTCDKKPHTHSLRLC